MQGTNSKEAFFLLENGRDLHIYYEPDIRKKIKKPSLMPFILKVCGYCIKKIFQSKLANLKIEGLYSN